MGQKDGSREKVFSMEILMFHYPLERACPKAQLRDNETYDKTVKIVMNDFKVNFMMEYMFRIQDYFFCQLIGPLSDSNPFYPLM